MPEESGVYNWICYVKRFRVYVWGARIGLKMESGASSIMGIKSAEYSHLKSNLSPLSVGASRILKSAGACRMSARLLHSLHTDINSFAAIVPPNGFYIVIDRIQNWEIRRKLCIFLTLLPFIDIFQAKIYPGTIGGKFWMKDSDSYSFFFCLVSKTFVNLCFNNRCSHNPKTLHIPLIKLCCLSVQNYLYFAAVF